MLETFLAAHKLAEEPVSNHRSHLRGLVDGGAVAGFFV